MKELMELPAQCPAEAVYFDEVLKNEDLGFLKCEVFAVGVEYNALCWESQAEAYGLCLNPAMQG